MFETGAKQKQKLLDYLAVTYKEVLLHCQLADNATEAAREDIPRHCITCGQYCSNTLQAGNKNTTTELDGKARSQNNITTAR